MRGCWLTVAPREGADWGDSWALHSPRLPQALVLCHPMRQPNSSPAHSHMSSYILCGGQSLPHHSSLCLVISCVSVKPFHPSSCLFLVILMQHNVTRNADLSFSFFLIILCVCTYLCVLEFVCTSIFFFSLIQYSLMVCISSMSKQKLQQPWHISECFFSRSLRKWSAPRLLIPLHSTVHQGDFVFTA